MNIKVGNIMSTLLAVMCVTGLSVAAPTTTGQFGTVDFFVTGNSSGNVYVFPSYGNGSFADKELVGNIGSVCLGSAIADFDNDGDLDLTIQNVNGDSYLLINNGMGGFAQTKVAEGLSLGGYGAESTTADFNNDGYYDYVVPSSGAYIYLFTNNKNNTFSESTISAEWLVTGSEINVLVGIDTGDFNEDGNMDFVIAEYRERGTDLVYSYTGNGDGTFKYKFAFDNTDYKGGDTVAVVAGDFDSDGHCDAIVGQDDDVDPGQTWLYKGDGTGNFTYFGEAYDTNPSIESGGEYSGDGCADAYDFDGDGNLDVVATAHKRYEGGGDSGILFFKGNGNGTFKAPVKVDEYMRRGISAPPIEVKPEMYATAVVSFTPGSYSETYIEYGSETGDDPAAALGPPDWNYALDGSVYYATYVNLGVNPNGTGGELVLDISPVSVVDGAGDDLAVYEIGRNEGFWVYLSKDGIKWTSGIHREGIANAGGDGINIANFDLTEFGIDRARYVKIIDDGDEYDYMGADIDAIIVTNYVISPIFTIADAYASPNRTTTTQITISNMTNFGAATVTLSYDPSVVHITDVTAGDVGTPTASINNTAGTSTIAAYVSTIPGPDSPIVFANLEILAVGSSGETSPLTLGITTLTDANGTTVPATTENGVFTIAGLRGDAKEDGVVDIVDAMYVAQYVVGNRDASDLNMANADANLDGDVTIVDAMFIAQYVVGARTW